MSVVVVGLEQPRTPLDLLERVAVGEEALGKALGALRDRSNLSEVVVLSTCLRTELYAVVERFHDGVADLQEFLAATAGATSDALAEHVKVLFDDDVTLHLFEVAAGLRSAVLGETEVLGQVRRAAERADAERASGPVLSALFRHAVKAGRRVRSSTALSRGSTSLSHVAVEVAASHLGGSLLGKRVVVVGAGEVADGVVGALSKARVEQVVVSNRTTERARSLAARTGARAEGLEALPAVLDEADAVIVATAASAPLLDRELLERAARPSAIRGRRRLVVVDMGMPRNVDPSARELDDVTLLDIEDLNAHAELAMLGRRAELAQAREIVAQEVERYRAAERSRGSAPVVSALRQRLDELVAAELERHGSRLSGLDDSQRRELEAVIRDVLAKLAHPPTIALKEAAGTPRGERLTEALRTLFEL
ncbi:MAG TPA: glutamyl-tRNA reductase [Acidimicrobiales bacterium]|nr:glutamyl-tRNA reductase [Acidimicrobiales bacterium]